MMMMMMMQYTQPLAALLPLALGVSHHQTCWTAASQMLENHQLRSQV
jgi:hypothetical protein